MGRGGNRVDIRSGSNYPASALSNFAPHRFVVDGVECASMEGLLQSLKFDDVHIQVEVCKLVGKTAKYRGRLGILRGSGIRHCGGRARRWGEKARNTRIFWIEFSVR
jgi:Bacteriophage protein GP30.3